MHVKGLIWLGLRTTQFEEMVKFFREVMGMQTTRDEPRIAGFELTNGTQVELYRPEYSRAQIRSSLGGSYPTRC